MTLWEIEIASAPGFPDTEHRGADQAVRLVGDEARRRFGRAIPEFQTRRGYLFQTAAPETAVASVARQLLTDPVVETVNVAPALSRSIPATTVTVLRLPGVMDPVAMSARAALADLNVATSSVRTFRRYCFAEDSPADLAVWLAGAALANGAIEQVVRGPWRPEHVGMGQDYNFAKITVPIRGMDDDALAQLSRTGQLALNLVELRAIRDHFDALGRHPTDAELETIAQTWSEHCSHKTFRGPYTFNGKPGKRGLLNDTIMHATRELARDWCVSVFVDNAGIVKFDDKWNVCFKVETHNRPSALEPYGGANTGLGGVIRDVLGAGLGAKPIANTDVFCVAPPTLAADKLPPGVLHPERILRGVVAGVRDYGNRMGIPTVNGAVCFDEQYVGNPLVFCGTVGLIPADKSFKKPQAGDLIVALGGRTGRDGIHGATFSSAELSGESAALSGGAVQIGNAITEKQVADVVLRARDLGLFHAITDCGAGGFSSAVGEMAAELGATVRLEAAPLKYAGLSYTEIWISEAQERMVLAVPPADWPALKALTASEGVEAVMLGHFERTGRLKLTYRGNLVADLDLQFLHQGRPPIVRHGTWPERVAEPHRLPAGFKLDANAILEKLLASPIIASKEWIIRQYDHEVQGGSVVKPLVGATDDGPSDAAVITPILGNQRGLAIGCGIQPRLGQLDPYRMAAAAIDEAIRNVVAVGGDPDRIALLDNFAWGNTERSETFGALCRAAFACRDYALAFGAPFISGKDSLNNEFGQGDARIAIPPTLLISALAIVPDIRQSITMDVKTPSNQIWLVGLTDGDLGGSQFNLVASAIGGEVPAVDAQLARPLYAAVHSAMRRGLIRSGHDCSEGGLAVALAEMAFAGNLGVTAELSAVPRRADLPDHALLFAESNSRLLLEVRPADAEALSRLLGAIPHAIIGVATENSELLIRGTDGSALIHQSIASLHQSWTAAFTAGWE